MNETLSPASARRIALAAQGFGAALPSEPGARQFRAIARRLGVIQIDSVNVVTRTHYLPTFSRIGAYPRTVLETEAWGRKPSLFEYWGHEASLLPIETQPLFRWRMAQAADGRGLWSEVARFGRERRAYIDEVLAEIGRRGPVTGGDFATGPRGAPGWWSWSDGKRALEWLFWAGFITTTTRRGFERVYDLSERALPSAIIGQPTPGEADAQRQLVRIAARAMGVATAADLRDYFRLPLEDSRARVAELVEAGELTAVTIPGWKAAFLDPAARKPRRIEGRALLSPFDNLIWARDRTERLFGVKVRLEIYTPAHKRLHGYYVLPFLQDEAITARVDLKSDRAGGVLRVQAAWREPDANGETAALLALELARMAGWLGLDRVEVAGRGDLAADLMDALPT